MFLARVSGQIGPEDRSPWRLVAPGWQIPWQICWALKPTSCITASSLNNGGQRMHALDAEQCLQPV
jgi:hypothetical protein